MGIFSSIFGAKALKKANANALVAQDEGYKEAAAMFSPFKSFGLNALSDYKDAIGIGNSDAAIASFRNSPLYRLQYDQAMKAGQEGVANMGNAAGMRNSGRTLMALQDNARDITNRTYGQYVNPLAGAADTGLGVAGTLANMRMGNADAHANYFMNKGMIKNAQMAGFDGLVNMGANALGLGGFGGLSNFLGKGSNDVISGARGMYF